MRITAPVASSAKATVKTSDFLTEADQDNVSPKNTMKKNGPHRSQSRNAFPGSSRYGFGNTTNFKLLTILDRSLFTVSQTGSVNVLGGGPKPLMVDCGRTAFALRLGLEGGGGAAGTKAGLGGGVGRLEGMNGDVDTGMEARVGDGGRAGRTVEGPNWTLAVIRFSISSMSDWEDWWRGTVSLSS